MQVDTKEKLIRGLIKDGYLKTQKIIDTFNIIDRKDFVPESLQNEAYGNYPLSIGMRQTISQPLTVAFMLELLGAQAGEKILDIGTGSGWQAALLAEIVGEQGKIISIERIEELKNFTESNLKKYDFLEKEIIILILGDGSKGYPEEAPYDKIIAAASGEKIPDIWKEQLKIGGRIVAPVKQSIFVLEKINQKDFKEMQYFGFNFVPLIVDNYN